MLIITVAVVIFHTRFSFYVSNGIGAVKVLTLIFIAITGWVVLGGHTSVPDPHVNFRNAFEGSATPYGITNALVKVIFSYSGYENSFNVANEVKVRGSLPRIDRANFIITPATESRQKYPQLCFSFANYCHVTLYLR